MFSDSHILNQNNIVMIITNILFTQTHIQLILNFKTVVILELNKEQTLTIFNFLNFETTKLKYKFLLYHITV